MSDRVFWLSSTVFGGLALLLCLWLVPGLATRAAPAQRLIISEVAWSGTAAGGTYEWIELFNNSEAAVDLTGWTLQDSDLLANLNGVIGAKEFYLLERNEFALIDISRDAVLIGQLADEGETLRLLDENALVVDTANQAGGAWPAGTEGPDFRSMERKDPQAGDEAGDWESNNGLIRNGFDTDGQPINGTPGQPNSGWSSAGSANLVLTKSGPVRASAGATIDYVLAITNTGQLTAANVVLTDTLPVSASYAADDSPYPLQMAAPDTLVWQIGSLDIGASLSINLSVSLDIELTGTITNTAEVTTLISETTVIDNVATFTSQITPPEPHTLIDAVYYDGYERQDVDEAVRLINVGDGAQELSGWRLSDGLSEAIFPPGAVLDPGEAIWIADRAASFRRQFGHNPEYEVRGEDPLVSNLSGTWPGFSNNGDEVLLIRQDDALQDALVYEDGNTSQAGWFGPALWPYVVPSVFAAEGQILYRQHDPWTGEPRADTDTAMDWAQYPDDVINGRRVRYPGWDLERFATSEWITETAEFAIGIAPDNAFELLQNELGGAQTEVRIMSHTFRSADIVKELIGALERGVEVTVLLEGNPVGGIEVSQQEACQSLEAAGGQCWFMISDSDKDIHDRYRYLHAKFIIIDGQRGIISTENLSPDSMPAGDKSEGILGRRGVLLATDAPGVVSHLQRLWQVDFDPANHIDLMRWNTADPMESKLETIDRPIGTTSAVSYTVRYTAPTVLSGEFPHAIIQAPENSMDAANGLLPLLSRADAEDTILVQQLTEKPHWGSANSDPDHDPNPRLEALISAARRGATVRLLLDDFFDEGEEPDSNWVTCQKVNAIATLEDLPLQCEQANPAGLGLHNKMILAQIDGQGYVVVGSINGTELSNKGNREVALMLQSDAAYALLADMFQRDWPDKVSMPLVLKDYVGPANHILISEVYYDSPGPDDAEFIELYNPSPEPLALDGFSLGDAVHRSDFEDVRRFPLGTLIDSGSTIVVASTASGFESLFGFKPDFEITDSDWSVPELIDDKNWGDPAAILQLANSGDEIILRNPAGRIIDAVAYGTGQVTGNVTCPLITLAGASFERHPPWRDTDHCPEDFREWPFPNPGALP